jgi:hypothetical protein
MSIFLELLSEALAQLPWFRRRRVSLFEPARPFETRAQEARLRDWAQAHRLQKVERDTWSGAIGRFSVELETFLRPEGALSMWLRVHGVGARDEGLPVDRTTKVAPWALLFQEIETLERVRKIDDCVEFSLRWNAEPEALSLILEHLEDLYLAAQAGYR